jgi:preprotein translocase subunit YajC
MTFKFLTLTFAIVSFPCFRKQKKKQTKKQNKQQIQNK